MKFLSVFLLIAISTVLAIDISEEEYQYQFNNFVLGFNKTYSSVTEFGKRYQVFKHNLRKITRHNLEGHTWTQAVNEFADLTWAEFKSEKLGYVDLRSSSIVPRETVNLTGLVTVPTSVNWVSYGAVTSVKNQGSCGSCWAFSAVESIEGAVFIKSRKLRALSTQQLVDCSGSYGNAGCSGGLMDYAFQYAIAKGGLCNDTAYAYTGTDGTCKTGCTLYSKITKYVDVSSYDETALEAAVAITPVSAAVEADQDGFQFYSSGVFSGTCGTNLDHGILIAGYGTSNGQNYWLIKNSWGTTWGQKGYMWLKKGSGTGAGQCGIAMQPSYPVV